MKFGKLKDISAVDFSLPNDPLGTQLVLEHLPQNDLPPRVYIGCTGWSMKEWVGKTYPTGTKSKDYLKAYAKQFNTIELNTTHYRIPQADLVQKWVQESTDDFRFCPKIPQSISHSKDLGISSDRIDIFAREILGLGEKLGCCFMQLPPYFAYDRISILERFLQVFPQEIPLAIEMRHESWFDTSAKGDALFKLLEKYNRATVITDVAGRRDVLHMRLTNDIAMIRFVGNELVDTDYSRIDEWLDRLSKWFDQNLKTVYFFPHEPDNLLAPELAAYLYAQVKAKTNAISRGPKFHKEDGGQMSLF